MVNKFLDRIKRHWHFLLFIFLFAYVQSIQIRIWVRGAINWYTFTPDAALGTLFSVSILYTIIFLSFQHWPPSDHFGSKEIAKTAGFSIVVHLLTMKTISFLIALIFNNIERNFNQETFLLALLSDFMDSLIYGSFFIAFYYFKKNKSNQAQINLYNQALAESRINQLKAQLNPHFLFNNLNVLDQLIEEDKEKASIFLNEFADIYRYVLHVTDKQTVALEEELTFAQKYFNLVQQKYNGAYLLEIEVAQTYQKIVPLSLQLLIENAVKHNYGTQALPVLIKIKADQTAVRVSNTLAPKRNALNGFGKALNNLKEQYALLTNKQVEITKTDLEFSVSIPLLPNPMINCL